MHRDSRTLLLLLLFASSPASRAQLFITNLNRIGVTTANTLSVKTNAPAGQSFTAVTNAIGWVDFLLDDANPSNGLPANLHVNLREYIEAGPVLRAVSGAVIASSYSVKLNNGHLTGSRTNETRFIFPTNVTLVISNRYWWELVWESGDDVRAHYYHLSFPDGDVITGGVKSPSDPNSIWDMAFNEGTIFQYPEIKNARLLTNGDSLDLQFEFHHLPMPCVLDVSSNLTIWTPLLTNTIYAAPYITIRGIGNAGTASPQYFRGRYLDQR
jgi:hypothetical protein